MKKLLVASILISIIFVSCVSTENSKENQVIANSQYYIDLDDYENAINELDKDTTGDYKALFNKAVYLSHLKRYEESIKVIDSLILRDNTRLHYLKLKAWNYHYLENTKDFEKTLDQLYLLKPLDEKISKYYIDYYVKVNNYEKAKEALWLLIDADINKKDNFEKLANIEKALESSTFYSNFYSML